MLLLSLPVQPVTSHRPVNMESLPVNNGNGQSSGYVLYETVVTSGGLLRSGNNVRDRALVRLQSTSDLCYVGFSDIRRDFTHCNLKMFFNVTYGLFVTVSYIK